MNPKLFWMLVIKSAFWTVICAWLTFTSEIAAMSIYMALTFSFMTLLMLSTWLAVLLVSQEKRIADLERRLRESTQS